MKQILQHLNTGEIELAELPNPGISRGQVIIQSKASLISIGTERMLVEFSKANLIQKARQQPDRVKQVLDKMKTDGVLPTLEAVFRKLDEPLPLGYCNSGIVIEVGEGVFDINPGDRVASNGPHAEMFCVSRNLCVKIPAKVSDEQAVYTVISSIALQGIRLLNPTLGEKILVIGLGLIGLITVQLLQANGCQVLAGDVNPDRLNLAKSFGAETVNFGAGHNPITKIEGWSDGKGVDGVIIAASSDSNEIISMAANACRKRGRVVLVGVVGLNLRRDDFYKKEITFQVSCSYGPGRYDEEYEQKGRDYPFGYVRWTERRNFEAVLDLMASGAINTEKLTTDTFLFNNALEAYEKVQNDKSVIGILLQYSNESGSTSEFKSIETKAVARSGVIAGIIGAGGFAKAILLPQIVKTKARLKCIADLNPVASGYASKKFGIEKALTDYKDILNDEEINTVFVLTGHYLHATIVCEALDAGKNVYVEKPLALKNDELASVEKCREKNTNNILMVGFNRRFSPHARKMKELLADRAEPLCMNFTVNAGKIPLDHWVQDPELGGGRIIGEGCHFIDLMRFLADSPIVKVSAIMIGGKTEPSSDKMAILLSFADGSIGSLNYFSNGSKRYPKEMFEVFSDGRVLYLNNFRVLKGFGFSNFKKYRTFKQDKGHKDEIISFIERVNKGGESLIPFNELVNVTKASFAAMESAKSGKSITL
ncbi:MAG: bi-domain-containing oxidoreductase [bacterium]